MRNVYQIGGKVIEIDSIYEEVHTLCKGCICGQIPDFKVETSQSDIDFERKKSAAESRKEGIPVRHYTDEYLETLAVYRKIAEQMLPYGILLSHGSVVADFVNNT